MDPMDQNGPYWTEMDRSVSQWTEIDCNTTIIWFNMSITTINTMNLSFLFILLLSRSMSNN